MRNLGIDILRLIAIFAVIVIHTVFIDTTARIVVLKFLPPANACFAFLAGWFLFDRISIETTIESIRTQLIKRFYRLGIPYLIWEGLYVGSNILFDVISGNPSLLKCTWISILFLGGGSTHLWFVATLIYVQSVLCGLVMAFLFISKKTKLHIRNVFLWFLGPIAVISLIIRFVGVENECARKFLFLFGYGAVGVLIRQVLIFEDIGKILRMLSLILFGSLLIMSYHVYVPEFVKVLCWVGFFSALPVKGKAGTLAFKCASCVMGIYLCHAFVTRAISFTIPMSSRVIDNAYILGLINAIFAFMISFGFVLGVKKVKCSRFLGF